MKTKKISVLVAVIMSAGLLLAGMATAAPQSIFLEIQASGKGYEAESDDPSAPGPGSVYTESKHTLGTMPLYAMCDRANGFMYLAVSIAPIGDWTIAGASIIETGKNLFVNFPGAVPVYIDLDSIPVYSVGALIVQFKLQNGTVSSAKMKSLAMSYFQNIPLLPQGNMQRFGTLKMKGKMIDQNDLPWEVQVLFGLTP